MPSDDKNQHGTGPCEFLAKYKTNINSQEKDVYFASSLIVPC